MSNATQKSIGKVERFRIFLLWAGLMMVVMIMIMMGLLFMSSIREQELSGKLTEAKAVERMVLSNLEGQVLYLDERLNFARQIYLSQSHVKKIDPQILLQDRPFKTSAVRNLIVFNAKDEPQSYAPSLDLPMDFAQALYKARSSLSDAPQSSVVIKNKVVMACRVLPMHSVDGLYLGAVVGVLNPSWVDDLMQDVLNSYGLKLHLLWTGFDITQVEDTKGRMKSKASLDVLNKSVHLALEARIEINPNEIKNTWSHSLYILALNLLLGIFCLTVAAFLIQKMYKKLTQSILQERLNQSEGEMRASFVANMSHELRTPVSGIVAACELLIHEGPSAEQLKTLELIQKAGVHLIKLLNDILDLSKMDAHSIRIKEELVDPHEVFAECVELFRPLANAKSLDLSVQVLVPTHTWVYVDAFRLTQVVTNLLANAIKFTAHGFIGLRVELMSCDSNDLEHVLKIIIEDSGIGIKQHEIERLFQPFFQADSSQNRAFGGTGLGLTISKQLVDLMGGHITVKSDIGMGSSFTVELPVQTQVVQSISDEPSNENTPQVAAPDQERPLAGLRVLFAEDNPIIQSVYSALMSSLGCNCSIASNGQEAFDQFTEKEFDAIVMDCHMPKVDGFEATLKIRTWEAQHPHLKPIPIIALTASFALEDQMRCKEVGVNEFCTKPLTRESLQLVLIQCLKD